MRRAPFVVAATGAGIGLLLSYHTHTLAASSGPKPVGVSSEPTTTTAPADGGSTTTTGPGASGPTTTPLTTSPTTSAERTATGQDISYRYGDIQLSVTETGSKIDNIQVAADDSTDPRSQQINEQAVPMLIQQAISAQSANIDGVSGATFTSNAFEQALQSAIQQS